MPLLTPHIRAGMLQLQNMQSESFMPSLLKSCCLATVLQLLSLDPGAYTLLQLRLCFQTGAPETLSLHYETQIPIQMSLCSWINMVHFLGLHSGKGMMQLLTQYNRASGICNYPVNSLKYSTHHFWTLTLEHQICNYYLVLCSMHCSDSPIQNILSKTAVMYLWIMCPAKIEPSLWSRHNMTTDLELKC